MDRIVICYRREDRAAAERLESLLRGSVSEAVDTVADDQSIDRSDLDALLENCGVCLVVVTPGWVTRHDALMRPRLRDALDVVRLVLEAVVRQDKAFLIVLDGDAVLPDREQLPETLRFLRTRGDVLHLIDDRRTIASFVAQILEHDDYAARFRPSFERLPTFSLYPYIPSVAPPQAPSAAPAASAPDDDNLPLPPEEVRQSVHLAAAAPQRAVAGSEFTARVAAYLPGEESTVREELGRLSPRAVAHMGLKACQWQRGTEVSVTLVASGLLVSPVVQSFVWNEGRELVEFDVAVPADTQPTTVVLKFDISIDSIIVARLRMDLEVVTRADSRSTAIGQTNGQAARTAFASYASVDRDRVLDRVAAVRISAGLEVFLDCLALHPGEEWKPTLEAQIAASDVFLLFWSRHAADSPWVTWEWQTALDRKGTTAMQIHPLQANVAAPEALRHLHFGDVHMLARGQRADT